MAQPPPPSGKGRAAAPSLILVVFRETEAWHPNFPSPIWEMGGEVQGPLP